MGHKTQDIRLREKPERFGFLSFGSCVLGLILAAAMCLAVNAADQQPAAPSHGFAVPKIKPVKAVAIAEQTSIQPGGHSRIGILFELEKGWHIYARDPGDAGMPTKVEWAPVNGVSFGFLRYPPVEEFLDPGEIKTHGYTGAAVLTTPIVVNRSVAAGTNLTLKAHAEWLACRDICLPGSADLILRLPVRAEEPAQSAHAELFDQVNP